MQAVEGSKRHGDGCTVLMSLESSFDEKIVFYKKI